MRASARSSSAIASAATSRSSPCATTKRSMTSNSAASRPSIRVTTPFVDDELGLGVVRAVRGDEPELGQRRDELLEVEIARRARREAAASHRRAAPARRRPRPPRARTPRSSSAPWPSSRDAHSSSSAAVARPRSQRRVDLEEQVVRNGGELGRALEALGELRPSRRARDLRLQPQRLRRRANLVRAELARPGGTRA